MLTTSTRLALAFSLSAVVVGCQGPGNGPPPVRDPAPPLYTESMLEDEELAMEALRLLGSSQAGGTE